MAKEIFCMAGSRFSANFVQLTNCGTQILSSFTFPEKLICPKKIDYIHHSDVFHLSTIADINNTNRKKEPRGWNALSEYFILVFKAAFKCVVFCYLFSAYV
jgi:hypothetical protein